MWCGICGSYYLENHLQTFLNFNFKESHWPNVQLRHALESIKEDQIEVDKYNFTAEKIGKEILKRGRPG